MPTETDRPQTAEEQERNPYLFKRNLFAAITAAAFAGYFLLGALSTTAQLLCLVAAFALVCFFTYYAQQARHWVVARRDPQAYDSSGRYHKDWEGMAEAERLARANKNAPNKNAKNKGKKKKQFNRGE